MCRRSWRRSRNGSKLLSGLHESYVLKEGALTSGLGELCPCASEADLVIQTNGDYVGKCCAYGVLRDVALVPQGAVVELGSRPSPFLNCPSLETRKNTAVKLSLRSLAFLMPRP